MTQLHDLRHGREAATPIRPGDLVVIGDADFCHINRVVSYGSGNRLHFIEQVTARQAQDIIDAGGEWCDCCHEHLATEIVTLEALELFDTTICPHCIEAERALLEQDYADTIADFAAMAGRM